MVADAEVLAEAARASQPRRHEVYSPRKPLGGYTRKQEMCFKFGGGVGVPCVVFFFFFYPPADGEK